MKEKKAEYGCVAFDTTELTFGFLLVGPHYCVDIVERDVGMLYSTSCNT